MHNDFDHIAQTYDADFTFSEIGKLQRKLVYDVLRKIPENQRILELNCGTGEDAIWFSKRGNKVISTDISQQMLQIARQKGVNEKNIIFEQLDIRKLNPEKYNEKFDLIFSNFGGMNCVNENDFLKFLKNASNILEKQGRLILVIMPKFCLWESLYFLIKGKWKIIFRRNTANIVKANIDGVHINTWYFNTSDVKNLASDFKIAMVKPIGFFIPPSYLEPFFKRNLKLLRILGKMENKIRKFSFLANYSDHYLIELEKQ